MQFGSVFFLFFSGFFCFFSGFLVFLVFFLFFFFFFFLFFFLVFSVFFWLLFVWFPVFVSHIFLVLCFVFFLFFSGFLFLSDIFLVLYFVFFLFFLILLPFPISCPFWFLNISHDGAGYGWSFHTRTAIWIMVRMVPAIQEIEKEPRLVLDSSVCNANLLCSIPEHVSLPSSLDVHRASLDVVAVYQQHVRK